MTNLTLKQGALIAMMMVVPTVFAQSDTLQQATEQLRLAMIDPTEQALKPLLMDGLSYGHSSGKVDTKTSFVGNLMTGKSDFVTIDLTEQNVQVTDDVAVVRDVFTAKTNSAGKPGEVHLKELQVWKKQPTGNWQLLARQAVKLEKK